MQVSLFSPAKINLSLAITGRRDDGFHELVSVVAPLTFGDVLHAETTTAIGETELTCDEATLATDESNLVRRAAKIFRTATGWNGGVRFRLEKRIPMGAGLGGGSSNAAAALQALRQVSGLAISTEELQRLAAEAGSDCPLFLAGGPVVMRGRGERVETLPASAAMRLRGRRVLVFKPGFGIGTAWAYARLAQRVRGGAVTYAVAEDVEARLRRWQETGDALAEELLSNTFEQVAFEKFIALPVMIEQLKARCGVTAHLSGSGSACFALLMAETDPGRAAAEIREGWGASTFMVECAVA